MAMSREAYSLGIYEKALPASLDIPGKLAAASRAGFDFVELSVDETEYKLARLDSGRAWRRALLQDMHDAGIRFATMCLSGQRKFPMGSPDPAIRARSMDILEKAIELSAELGIRIIQIAGYDVYYEPSTDLTKSLFAENLARAVRRASAYGVILAFETMETPFMNTVEKALRYVRAIDSPYLQIYPDVGNVTNAFQGNPGLAALDILGGSGRLAAIHLKESAPGIYREIPYGRGHVDFDACIDAGLRAGARIFTAEFWHTGSIDWENDLSFANRFMREKLDRLTMGIPS